MLKKNLVAKRGMVLMIALSIALTSVTGCGKSNAPAADCAAEAPASEADYSYSEPMVEAEAPADAYEYTEQSADCAPAVNSYSSSKKQALGATAESATYDRSFRGPYNDYGYTHYNNEEYSKEEENGFKVVEIDPLSTFSADVDTASYANVRRMIMDGYSLEEIDPDAVRPEEFINYFSYNLKQPKRGDKFGLSAEVAECPWNEDHSLMMVGMTTKPIERDESKPTNLVFLIDVSGSMFGDDRLGLLQKSFKELTKELNENDRVSIVTYASGVSTVLEGASGDQHKKIIKALEGLKAGGSTNGEGGLMAAYDLAEENFIEEGNNRVILATDGDLNVGISSESELKKFIEKKRKSGIYLSVLGFGSGNLKDNKMETLADYGNGNYAYIDSLMEAKKVLVEEMSATLETVADDVKLQVEFNPEYVNAYRLIGYENRMLDAADFNNDKKDAGEIGAGHSVVALYEIIWADTKDSVNLKYGKKTARREFDGEYATLSVRYKEPGESKSELVSVTIDEDDYTNRPSDDFIFAAGVAEFAQILADSDNMGDASLEDVREALKRVDMYEDEYKEEFAYLVQTLIVDERRSF
jgi:Ca-activated chloride channel family protein